MEAEKPKSKALTWFLGCLAALVVFAVLCAGGTYLAWDTMVDKFITIAHGQLVEVVERSELPDDQIASMKDDLGRLLDAALDGKVEYQRMDGLEREMERVLTLGMLQWFGLAVVEDSGLSAEEAADAKRTLERFARGVQNGQLSPNDLDRFELKNKQRDDDNVWDTESTRRTIAEMRTLVDEAGIPDEPFQADVAKEFSLLIDGLLENDESVSDE